MVFHWSLSDSKSPQVSRTRVRILAVFSNAVVWIVTTRPSTSKSSRPFNNPLVIVPKAPITIGTIVIFMFHSFFNSLARSRYLSFFSLSFRFILMSAGTAKSTILQILFFFLFFFFFLLIIMRSGLLAGIRWSVCMLKSHRSLCESFSRTYYYYLCTNWILSHVATNGLCKRSSNSRSSKNPSSTLLNILIFMSLLNLPSESFLIEESIQHSILVSSFSSSDALLIAFEFCNPDNVDSIKDKGT